MEITKAIIDNNAIIITLNLLTNISKIYLDSVHNDMNVSSDIDDDHTYIITEYIMIDNVITIDITAIKENAFVVTVIDENQEKSQAIAIDEGAIYELKIQMLLNNCNRCLNSHDKEKIILLQLRSNLLQYSLDNNMLLDSIMHYKDVDRILNDRVTNNKCCL